MIACWQSLDGIANPPIIISAMDGRAAEILEATVREFIELGEPVSSGWLYGRYDFGVKPAMIRVELCDLTDRGYLAQPHHSAGRMPTDRGYEFFVKHLLEGEEDGEGAASRLREHFLRRAWPSLLEEFSEALGILGVASDISRDAVYKGGLEHLIEHLDWESREEVQTVIHDFEELEEQLRGHMRQLLDEDFKVFIGRKSPITRASTLAVMVGNYRVAGEQVMLLAIGPKRMDYPKVVRIFRGLKQYQNGK